MKRVVLHGRLKELYPDEILLDVASAAEAIKGLCSLTDVFNPTPSRPRLCLRAIGYRSDIALRANTDADEIHLILDMSGGGGAFKIILGVVIVAIGIYTGNAGLIIMGAGMMLQGIVELLSPSPKANGQDPNLLSKYFGPPGNTVKIGTRIPVLYGETQVFGQFLSFDVVTDQLVICGTTAAVVPLALPTGVTLTPYLTGITIGWVNNTAPNFAATEIWASNTPNFVDATLLTDSADTKFNDELGATDTAAVQRWYWFRTKTTSNTYSAYGPDTGTPGNTAVTGAPATTRDGGGTSADNAGGNASDASSGSDSQGGHDGGDTGNA